MIVRVRQRQYFVEEVVPPAPGTMRPSCACRASTTTPRASRWKCSGRRRSTPRPITAEAWQEIASRGFDPPKLFSAYLHTLQWNCVTSTDPNLFQSPFRAGIRIDAYQLEPLQKALRLPRVNLFIADDVGLGKTIEAGLIARELLLRKKVQDIVVSCPPSMLFQWQDELEDRFGLVFQILDKDYIARVRQERGYGVNPWTTHSRFLVSHRLLIDEAYTATLRDWLGDFRPGSLLILDEAHHAAPSSGAKYAIDSKITRAVRDLAGRFEHRLFLSATPHNGHSNSFSALLEILDPQRFCRGVPVRAKKVLEAVMVRRLKEDLRAVAGGFPRRVVRQIDLSGLPADTPELRLSVLLDQYRELREERLKSETQTQAGHRGIADLRPATASAVLGRSVRPHAPRPPPHRPAAMGRGRGRDGPTRDNHAGEPSLFAEGIDNDDDRATLSEEELQAEEEAQIEAATRETSSAGTDAHAREKQLLDQMTEVAEAARGLPDARVRKLVDWIRENDVPGPAPAGDDAGPRHAGPMERHPDHHLHRVRRHQALPPATAHGRHRHHRPGRRADRRLSRPDPAGRTRGDQAGLHDQPEQEPAPHPDRHRRRPRGPEPPDPLLEPVPFRRALEPEPHGAAQRPHRPQAPAQRRGLLPLLRLHRPQGRPHPVRPGPEDGDGSNASWAASPRCSKAAWPGRSSTASATATSSRSKPNSKAPTRTATTGRSSRRSWKRRESARKT